MIAVFHGAHANFKALETPRERDRLLEWANQRDSNGNPYNGYEWVGPYEVC